MSLIFCLAMPQRFSFRFRSSGFAGLSNTVTPWSLNHNLVFLAVWADALIGKRLWTTEQQTSFCFCNPDKTLLMFVVQEQHDKRNTSFDAHVQDPSVFIGFACTNSSFKLSLMFRHLCRCGDTQRHYPSIHRTLRSVCKHRQSRAKFLNYLLNGTNSACL